MGRQVGRAHAVEGVRVERRINTLIRLAPREDAHFTAPAIHLVVHRCCINALIDALIASAVVHNYARFLILVV